MMEMFILEPSERLKKIKAVLGWVLLANLSVALAKLIYGQISNSMSIWADGLHSLTDSASNVIGLLALASSSEEADIEHPYGHRKLEIAGAVGIGILVILGMVEIGEKLWNSIGSDYAVRIGTGGFGVLLLTLALNGVVTSQENKWGKRLKSPILLADAKHTLSDTMATVGVLAAFILTMVGVKGADAVVAVLIMVLVGRAAYMILRQGVDVLLDRSILDASEIEQTVRAVKGVLDCHKVRSRGMAGAVFMDFHILVDSKLSMESAHRITHEAEHAVRNKFPEVIDVVIHTEPLSSGHETQPWEKGS